MYDNWWWLRKCVKVFEVIFRGVLGSLERNIIIRVSEKVLKVIIGRENFIL